jgi:hypothetical protein
MGTDTRDELTANWELTQVPEQPAPIAPLL